MVVRQKHMITKVGMPALVTIYVIVTRQRQIVDAEDDITVSGRRVIILDGKVMVPVVRRVVV